MLSVQSYQCLLAPAYFCSLQVAVGWLPIWPLLVGESSCRLVGAQEEESEGETKSHLVGYHISRPPSPCLNPAEGEIG